MEKQNPKIVVTEETKTELDTFGEKGDTYEDIIKKLISIAKENKKGRR